MSCLGLSILIITRYRAALIISKVRYTVFKLHRDSLVKGTWFLLGCFQSQYTEAQFLRTTRWFEVKSIHTFANCADAIISHCGSPVKFFSCDNISAAVQERSLPIRLLDILTSSSFLFVKTPLYFVENHKPWWRKTLAIVYDVYTLICI